jgi:hypothetical protein
VVPKNSSLLFWGYFEAEEKRPGPGSYEPSSEFGVFVERIPRLDGQFAQTFNKRFRMDGNRTSTSTSKNSSKVYENSNQKSIRLPKIRPSSSDDKVKSVRKY